MPNINLITLDQLLPADAIAQYQPVTLPISEICQFYAYPGTVGQGDQFRPPYAENTSGSVQWVQSNGYNTPTMTLTGKTATFQTRVFQQWDITDDDRAKLTPSGLAAAMTVLMGQADSDAVSGSLASVISNANYPNSSSFPTANFTSSAAALPDLWKYASDKKFNLPGQGFLVADTTFYQNLLINTYSGFNNLGTGVVQQSGKFIQALGFIPYWTNVTLPVSDHAFVCGKNFAAIGFGTPNPPMEIPGLVDWRQFVNPSSKIPYGVYTFYNNLKRTQTVAVECAWASVKLDGNALYHIK